MATASANHEAKNFPLAGLADDGWSKEGEATSTCYCGAVQLAFPTSGPGLIDTFRCHCSDCHKFSATMFATNFTIDNPYLKHLRGQENLKTFSQSKTIASGNDMTNHFCSTCGTLLYRRSSGMPTKTILRTGTVDDFSLHDTVFKPEKEQFVVNRVAWVPALEGVEQWEGESPRERTSGH